LREWFEAEPWRTSSELLSKLQAENPGIYPSKLLRTLQCRLNCGAASKQASVLVFGSGEHAAQSDVIITSPESPQLLDRVDL